MNYEVNGEKLTAEEYQKRYASRNRLRLKEMLESRTPPGGHEPYWGTGFRSIAAGVHPAKAREHQEWCRREGLTGVEVKPDGSIEYNSPGARLSHVHARGMEDIGTAGSGGSKLSGPREPTKQELREEYRQSPARKKKVRELAKEAWKKGIHERLHKAE